MRSARWLLQPLHAARPAPSAWRQLKACARRARKLRNKASVKLGATQRGLAQRRVGAKCANLRARQSVALVKIQFVPPPLAAD